LLESNKGEEIFLTFPQGFQQRFGLEQRFLVFTD
jgi:hypothetical protein